MVDAYVVEAVFAASVREGGGLLLCRYDHPATDCKVMGFEIDRRLAEVTTDS